VGVQEVRWEGSGTVPAGEYTFFYGKGNETNELGTEFLAHKRIISAVKRVESVSEGTSYNVLNIHTPTKDKTDGVNGSSHEELENIFDTFL
jgi:hypothetical protein